MLLIASMSQNLLPLAARKRIDMDTKSPHVQQVLMSAATAPASVTTAHVLATFWPTPIDYDIYLTFVDRHKYWPVSITVPAATMIATVMLIAPFKTTKSVVLTPNRWACGGAAV